MSYPVEEGDILAGKYRVETVLGKGGMGVVVAATHLQLKERVALKFLLPQSVSEPEFAARFQREAQRYLSSPRPWRGELFRWVEVSFFSEA